MKKMAGRKEIISQLKKKILAVEGFSAGTDSRQFDFGLGPVKAAFPDGVFPVGAIHEFSSPDEACAASTTGFLSGLLRTLMKKGGICLWIGVGRRLFPSTLKFFGIEPHRVIFIDVKTQKDALWVMEQSLKSEALSAVVAELREVSFAESRRLQMAAASSGVTGFLHRRQPRLENALACVSRWKITPLPSRADGELPGVGFPRFEVELVKMRNGRQGTWEFEWRNGNLYSVPVQKPASLSLKSDRKDRKYA